MNLRFIQKVITPSLWTTKWNIIQRRKWWFVGISLASDLIWSDLNRSVCWRTKSEQQHIVELHVYGYSALCSLSAAWFGDVCLLLVQHILQLKRSFFNYIFKALLVILKLVSKRRWNQGNNCSYDRHQDGKYISVKSDVYAALQKF